MRKKFQKLASLLDLSQGAVIKRAHTILEEKIITGKRDPRDLNPTTWLDKQEIRLILQDATREVLEVNLEIKRFQEKLFSGPETIDDFILNDWDSGLE